MGRATEIFLFLQRDKQMGSADYQFIYIDDLDSMKEFRKKYEKHFEDSVENQIEMF